MILASAALAQVASVADMRGDRRVMVIAAPADADAQRLRQHALLRDAGPRLAERDVTIVDVTADRVRGAADTAESLRSRLDLPPARFVVVLIGKDGHVALRRSTPIDADTLVATIDAMPMRRAGLR